MKTKLLPIVIMGMVLSLLNLGGLAEAAVVDTIQYPTGYFVDSDANKTAWPYYRWYGDDWGWTHNPIAGPITSATLNISAYDVDYVSGERDIIYAYDNGVMTSLGYLTGADNAWSYATFALGSSFFDDIANGLQVYMVIDSTQEAWAVTLAKSVLEVDGGTLPPPAPNPSVPVPAPLLLLGSGLVGLAGWTRKSRKR